MSMQIEEKLQNEEISLAPFAKRIMAFSIDEIIVSFLFMIIYWEPLSTSTNYDDARNLVLNLFLQVVALKVIYHTFFVWYYGASLGQMITKTMCINVEILDKPNLTQSLVRAIFRIVSEACFYLGFAWALSNPARQTWQDKIAKTVVINA